MPTEFKKTIQLSLAVMNSPNLCSLLDPEDLQTIGSLVKSGYDKDMASRSQWQQRIQAGMDLALQVQKAKNWPWPNCANVTFPLVTIAALQFSSRAYSHIISGPDIANYRVVGDDPTGELEARAVRISTHMSWQVMEQDEPWEEQQDRGFFQQAIVGTRFMKTYFSGKKAFNVGELVSAFDLVMDYFAKSVDECGRKTHRLPPMYRNDIFERVREGVFCDVLEESWYKGTPGSASTPATTYTVQSDNRIGVSPPPPDDDTPFQFLEQHRTLDLDGDGYGEPYIVTIEEASSCVVRIVARWDSETQIERNAKNQLIRIRPTEYFTKYGFIPSPDGGIYDIGFGVLLGPLNEAVNTGIDQLLDSGTMQNSLGGFLGRGAKIRGGDYTMAPWEWKRVDSTGDDLRKNLVPYPDRQPSVVMFNLLGLLIEYSNRVASVADQMVGKTPGQNTPAETSRTAMEQGMQVFTTIFKRTWRSMKQEFKKRFLLNQIHLPSQVRFGAGNSLVNAEDYKSNPDLIVPAADPEVISFQLRFFQAQSIRQASQQVPGYDIDYVERQFLRAMKVKGVDKYFPGSGKVAPPPNPKIVVAEMQLKIKQLQLQDQRQQWIMKLMEEKRLNNAKIIGLQAKAAADLAGIDADIAAVQLEHLNLALETLKAHNEAISRRIEVLSAETAEADSGESNEGNSATRGNPDDPTNSVQGTGLPELATGTPDEGGLPADEVMGGGAQESMGS